MPPASSGNTVLQPSVLQSSDVANVIDQLGAWDSAVIVHDLDVLDAYLDVLKASFPSSTRHSIAIKSMPHLEMLKHLVKAGFGLEAASYEEVELASLAGAKPHDIIFDSPVKTRHEIEECERRWPGLLVNANSIAELDRYDPATDLQVGLRVNPRVSTHAPGRFDVSGADSKFGVSIADVAAVRSAMSRPIVSGVHMHIGSQVPGTAAHLEAVERLLTLAEGVPGIEIVDIGGGITAEPLSSDMTMMHYGRELQEQHPTLFDYEVRTEFGQWVHAHAGWAATRVEYLEDHETPMAFVHLGADYFMRDVYTEPRSFGWAVYKRDGRLVREPERSYDIAGPLCFAGDVLARNLRLPELEEGDWLIIEGTGANTLGLWSRHCSRDIPKVVASQQGTCTTWSERESVRSR